VAFAFKLLNVTDEYDGHKLFTVVSVLVVSSNK
jgi:hypothetical protein